MKPNGTFTSCTNTHVYYDLFVPQILIRPRGIVQIHHGLGEHRGRYIDFAKYLRSEGYVVMIIDFPGHGESLYQFEQGYFGNGSILHCLIKDIHHVYETVREDYPDLPYFILGNQFSTLVVRQYLLHYGEYIQGAILLSPGYFHQYRQFVNYTNCSEVIKGNMYRSQRLKKMLDCYFNDDLKENNLTYLTSDKEEIQKYIDDTMTDFVYTNKAYKQIIQLSKLVSEDQYFSSVLHDLSIYILSGKKDNFGKCGKIAKILHDKYKKAGIIDVSVNLYDNMGQDLLHESNKNKIYEDIITWLNTRTYM